MNTLHDGLTPGNGWGTKLAIPEGFLPAWIPCRRASLRPRPTALARARASLRPASGRANPTPHTTFAAWRRKAPSCRSPAAGRSPGTRPGAGSAPCSGARSRSCGARASLPSRRRSHRRLRHRAPSLCERASIMERRAGRPGSWRTPSSSSDLPRAACGCGTARPGASRWQRTSGPAIFGGAAPSPRRSSRLRNPLARLAPPSRPRPGRERVPRGLDRADAYRDQRSGRRGRRGKGK